MPGVQRAAGRSQLRQFLIAHAQNGRSRRVVERDGVFRRNQHIAHIAQNFFRRDIDGHAAFNRLKILGAHAGAREGNHALGFLKNIGEFALGNGVILALRAQLRQMRAQFAVHGKKCDEFIGIQRLAAQQNAHAHDAGSAFQRLAESGNVLGVLDLLGQRICLARSRSGNRVFHQILAQNQFRQPQAFLHPLGNGSGRKMRQLGAGVHRLDGNGAVAKGANAAGNQRHRDQHHQKRHHDQALFHRQALQPAAIPTHCAHPRRKGSPGKRPPRA